MQAPPPTPPHARPVPIPLTWLERNFNTRSRTEQLLRPELEDGLITQHDFEAAVDFFPGPQRYYSIVGGSIGTLSIVVWRHMFRRPSIPSHRIVAFAAIAFSGGFTGGTIVRANAHADFFRNLDNRTAFFQAIDNIQTRIGGKPPDAQTNSTYPAFENESPEHPDTPIKSRGWEGGSPVNTATMSRSTNLPSSPQTSQPKSRWEEIRAEHARNIATRSSWDELRQNASRPKGDADQPDRSQDPAAERLGEQQKYDAMLDAERQKAAEGMQANSWESSI